MSKYILMLGFVMFFQAAAFADSKVTTLDVAEVALGMTQQQAAAAVAQNPELSPLAKGGLTAEFNRNDLPEPIILFHTSHEPKTMAEEITVFLTAQPAEQKVWKVIRHVTYQQGQQPVLDNVNAAIIQKYGSTPTVSANNGNQLTWVYDLEGNPLASAEGAGLISKCVSDGIQALGFDTSGARNKFLNLVNFPNDRVRMTAPAECNNYRFARVQLSTTDGFVSRISVVLVDMSIGMPALHNTLKYVDDQINAAASQKLNDAQSIQPKL